MTKSLQSSKVQMCPNGPEFSRFVQGYWRLNSWDMNPQQRLSFLKQHIELGVSTVDHAHVYGPPSCEELFGEALKLNSSVRQEIQIVSKCGINLNNNAVQPKQVSHYSSDRKNIIKSVETSLRRLRTDYLDALLLHRPDFLMNVDEIAAVFSELKESGKVKFFGVSNFSASQFLLLDSRLDSSLITNQVEINPINFDVISDGTLDLLQQNKVSPMAWSCLAGGEIFHQQSEQIIRLRKTLLDIQNEIGASSIEQVIFAWIAKLPSNPVMIIGSGKVERVIGAIESENYTLTREQWYRIWVASKGFNVP